MADAAVAARRPRPPGVVTARHHALKLIHVADEVTLAAIESLLELFELSPPAFDPILAKLDVGLEFGLPLVEIALPAAQLEDSRVGNLLRERLGNGFAPGPEQGRKRGSLFRRDLDSQDEWIG